MVLEALTYDIFGNRLTRSAEGSAQVYVHDTAHQLQTIRDGSASGAVLASFQYDENGNITQKSVGGTTTTLVYDALNRVSQVSRTGIATQTYAYDYFGRRIRKSIGADSFSYLYDGPDIVAEYSADWTGARAIYLNGPQWDDTIARTSAGKTSYYHRDGLNSVVAMTSGAGALTATTRYDSWGNTVAGSGAIPHYGYTGREPDETGLIYYRARYYDPAIGRFTQMDPAGFVDGINRYAYAVNSPINYVDPMGMSIGSPLVSGSTSGTYFSQGIQDSAQASHEDWSASLGIGGAVHGPVLGPLGIGVSGGIAVGLSYEGSLLDSRLFLQVQAAGMIGSGVFAGIGVSGQVAREPVPLGMSTTTSWHSELNVGVGIGGSAVVDVVIPSGDGQAGGFHGRLPGGRLGVAVGAAGGTGAGTTTTFGTPTFRELIEAIGW